MDEDQQRLEKLLTQGYLSGSQYDDIERRVLRSAARPRGVPSRLALLAAALAAVLGCCLVALLLVRTPIQGPFASRGADEPGQKPGAFEVGCRPLSRVCQAGDTLMFSVNTHIASGQLGAYAERVDEATKERIWYFPAPDGSAPVVAKTDGTIVIQQGVRIGPEHLPGRYRVHMWATPDPLVSREQVERLPGASVLEIEVIP